MEANRDVVAAEFVAHRKGDSGSRAAPDRSRLPSLTDNPLNNKGDPNYHLAYADSADKGSALQPLHGFFRQQRRLFQNSLARCVWKNVNNRSNHNGDDPDYSEENMWIHDGTDNLTKCKTR